MKQPNQHLVDKYTSIDDLLAKLIEQNALLLDAIDVDIDDEVHFFTYPKNGTRAALAAGMTELDYEQGTVIDVDGGTSDMNSSLRRIHKPACRSIALNADQDLIIQINNKDRIPVTAGTWFKATYLRFQRVKIITTATTTNTFILACTHPNAIDITGEVLIKDTTDVWGNSAPMGLGELAVRTHAPPITFDRRGDVLRWVDFESATPNYKILTFANPTYGRSTAIANHGNFSYKSVVTSTNIVQIDLFVSDFHVSRLGAQMVFTSPSSNVLTEIGLSYYDGVDLYASRLRYNISTGVFSYLDSASAQQTIDTVSYYESLYNFSSIKLVIDVDQKKYVRALLFGKEYDLSAYALPSTTNVDPPVLRMISRHIGTDGSDATIYVDNMVLTENEPL